VKIPAAAVTEEQRFPLSEVGTRTGKPIRSRYTYVLSPWKELPLQCFDTAILLHLADSDLDVLVGIWFFPLFQTSRNIVYDLLAQVGTPGDVVKITLQGISDAHLHRRWLVLVPRCHPISDLMQRITSVLVIKKPCTL